MLLATAALAAAVLFRSAPDYRMPLCIIVSTAALALAVRSLSIGKIAALLMYLGILGAFTPFRLQQFSPSFISILDLVTLVLFAASPMILRQSRTLAVVSVTQEKL